MQDKSLSGRLKRLFDTNVVVRKIGGPNQTGLKVVDSDHLQSVGNRNNSRYIDRYSRLHTGRSAAGAGTFNSQFNYYNDKISLYTDYECLSGDTIIPTPDKFENKTIRELSELYPNKDTKFYVYSFDEKSNSIKLGEAHSVRKTKTEQTYKITFDDGKFIKATGNHPFLMRNGEYKSVSDLQINDSVMPFYMKDFYGQGYNHIYNFSKKWQPIHRIVAEQFDREINSDEVVHHKDFNKNNNLPNNLEIMTKSTHSSYHMNIINKDILWSPENKEKQRLAVANGIRKFYESEKGKLQCENLSKSRMAENNPFFGKHHTKETIDARRIRNQEKKANGFVPKSLKGENNPNFKIGFYKRWVEKYGLEEANIKLLEFKAKQSMYVGEQSARYIAIPKDVIISEAVQILKDSGTFTAKTLASRLNTKDYILRKRIAEHGMGTFTEFYEYISKTLNHKIVSIELAEIEDVYDMTVDEYHNFATESCFVHNCMDTDSIISAALDIYQEETILKDDFGDVLRITSDNEEIQEILTNLFYDILNIDFNLGPWVRNLCKYGDFYLHLNIQENLGIVNVAPLSAYEIQREEGFNLNNPEEVRFRSLTSQQQIFENYEIIHFRMLADSNFLPYGRSMLEGARKVWKSLTLMEDAMLINRIMRAPEKRIYKIDIGNIPPHEVDAYMEKIINKMKKVPYMNQQTGEYNLKFNMQNMLEDIYLPIRGGQSGTEIDTLGGIEFTGIDDIEYLRVRMMAALKIPAPFLGYSSEVAGKATLAAMDVRFARTIEKIQSYIISELYKIAIVHLTAQGYTDSRLVNFKLTMTSPSTIYEEEKLALYATKVSLASDMIDNKLVSKEWIYKNIFNFTETDIVDLEKQIIHDQKTAYRYSQIESDGEDPNNPVKPKKMEVPEDDTEQEKPKQRAPSTADADQPEKETQTEEGIDMSAAGRGMPKDGWPDSGRPKEPTKYNSHKHPRGYDPIGSNAWKRTRKEPSNEAIMKKYGLDKLLKETKKIITEIQIDSTDII